MPIFLATSGNALRFSEREISADNHKGKERDQVFLFIRNYTINKKDNTQKKKNVNKKKCENILTKHLIPSILML